MAKNKQRQEITEEILNPRNVKEKVSLYIDHDIVNWLRSTAEKKHQKYQSLANQLLRAAMSESDSRSMNKKLDEILKRLPEAR
jgi:uncharacterized protein (DUF4415 family)